MPGDQRLPGRPVARAHRPRPAARPMKPPLPELDPRTDDGPALRWDKVRAIRAALAAGAYDVEEHLEVMLSRLPGGMGDAKP